MKKYLLLILLTLPFLAMAQENWELKKNENGIAVYSRKLENEKFKQIRVVTEFNGTVNDLYKTLQNVNHHKDWVYGTTESYFIKRKGTDTVYYYSAVNLPWPASDRDLTVQLSFKRDSVAKTLNVQAMGVNNLLPEKKGLVRVPYSLGLWNITQPHPNSVRIDYTFSVNPGGSLPAWLVNMMAVKGPFNTFKNLKEVVEKGGH